MTESLRLRDSTSSPALRDSTGSGALRQDGYVTNAPVPLAGFVSARIDDYGTVDNSWLATVRWSADETPTATLPASGEYNIAEVRIIYNWEGPPEFWNDGIVLDTYTPLHSVEPTIYHDNISTSNSLSNWLYYSLFYKYQDSAGANFVTRAATTSVLVPTKHDLGETMWKKIPRLYRRQDKAGHLEKFIKVFGWEADYMRSLVDELLSSKDPLRTQYNSLNTLASLVGSSFTTQELRPSQMRELIHDADKYFDQKGRSDALIAVLSVITDSEVSSREFTNTGSPTTSAYERIKVFVSAARANLIVNPTLVGTPSSSGTWNYLTSGTVVPDYNSASTGVTFTTTANTTGTVYLFPRTPVQIKRKVPYYSSVEASMTNTTGQMRLYREEPTNAASLPDQSKYFTTDDSTYADYYKDLTVSDAHRYGTGEFKQRSGFYLTPSYAETCAIFEDGTTNGVLFRARLYASGSTSLYGYSLKLTRVDANPSSASSASRFDRFDLAVYDGSTNVLTANNLTVNASGELIDEDTSAVVTKLTQTTGGIDFTLLFDEVVTPTFAADFQLPSDDTSTYDFRQSGVEDLYPVIVLTLGNSASVTIDKWIFQPFSDGPYFDGSGVDGHSYLDGSYITSDYYWSGTDNASVSLYTPVRKRNRAAVRKVLADNLPVTMSTELTAYATDTNHGHIVTFDSLPGDERACDPHSWNADVYTEGTIRTNSD
jgi:hypothetical protein